MNQLEKCHHFGTRLVSSATEIRALRIWAGLTLRAIAEKLGVKSSYINYFEAGRRNPSGDFILNCRELEKTLRSPSKR